MVTLKELIDNNGELKGYLWSRWSELTVMKNVGVTSNIGT